jgi:hypothetical protein
VVRLEQLASLGSVGQVQRVGIEATGIGGVRQVADTVQQVWRLTGNQHDRPSRAEAHDFIGRQQRTALQMLPGARGRTAGLAPGAARLADVLRLIADGLLAERAGQISGGIEIRRAEELLRGVGGTL